MGVVKSQSGLPCRASTIFTLKPQPAEHDRGQRDDEDFLDQLTSQPSLRISQRGPQKPESLLRKRREELHAHGVRRERVETGMGQDREEENQRNPGAGWRPLCTAEENARRQHRAEEREKQ